MKFNALAEGHNIIMDASEESGGGNEGVRPKQLMISALAGCTGMDVISILKKMRVEVQDFNVDIEADVTEDHPKHYTSMHLVYSFKGNNLDHEKLEKAINMSQEKYCGVSAVYKKTMKITYEIKINN